MREQAQDQNVLFDVVFDPILTALLYLALFDLRYVARSYLMVCHLTWKHLLNRIATIKRISQIFNKT